MVAARIQGQNYRITTPGAVSGVRGTDFVVSLTETGEATVAVKEGRVAAYDPQTEGVVSVGDGQALETATQRSTSVEDQEQRLELSARPFTRLRTADVPSEAGYESEFDYFSAIEWEEYREFFANDDYFADYQQYMERFRTYYESEMEDFQAILEREAQELEKRERSIDETLGEQEESFQDWIENNGS